MEPKNQFKNSLEEDIDQPYHSCERPGSLKHAQCKNYIKISISPKILLGEMDILSGVRGQKCMWGPQREFSVPTSFVITTLPDLLDNCKPLRSRRRRRLQTFYLVWGPHREFTCPTSFKNIYN